MDTPAEFVVGLRFDRRELPKLKLVAATQRAADRGAEIVGLMEKAASATAVGEPLRILCTDPTEAILVAEGFARHGIKPPSVEALRGGGG